MYVIRRRKDKKYFSGTEGSRGNTETANRLFVSNVFYAMYFNQWQNANRVAEQLVDCEVVTLEVTEVN